MAGLWTNAIKLRADTQDCPYQTPRILCL